MLQGAQTKLVVRALMRVRSPKASDKLNSNLEEDWLPQGTSLTPGLASWCNTHALEQNSEKRVLSHTLELPPLRFSFSEMWWPCVGGRMWKRGVGWPSCWALSTQWAHGGRGEGLAFPSWGTHYFQRLIKMPDPQGPLTHTSIFVCIMKAEQLLDLVIREKCFKKQDL